MNVVRLKTESSWLLKDLRMHVVEVKSQFVQVDIIRIYHECAGGIAITVCHHSVAE